MNPEIPKEVHGSKFHNALTKWRAEYLRLMAESNTKKTDAKAT